MAWKYRIVIKLRTALLLQVNLEKNSRFKYFKMNYNVTAHQPSLKLPEISCQLLQILPEHMEKDIDHETVCTVIIKHTAESKKRVIWSAQSR